MFDSPAPSRRLRLPDARTIIGIVLVIAAVAGVFAVLALGRSPARVYRATADLPVGEAVDIASLEVVEVELGEAAAGYLAAGAAPDEGVVATRPIAAGELLPIAALGAPDVDSATVLVPVEGSLPASAAVGASVELWASAKRQSGERAAPVVLVREARIVRIDADGGVIRGIGTTSVELRVPRGDVAAVLGAVGDEALLSIVPRYAAAG